MKQAAVVFLFFVAVLSAQSTIGPPFAVLPVVAPVAGVPGVQLAYDITNKWLYIQAVNAVGASPVTIFPFNPHILDNGGNFAITISVNGTPIAVTISTSGTSLVYRLSNGNVAQDKFCSTASPLPTGAVACAAIPF